MSEIRGMIQGVVRTMTGESLLGRAVRIMESFTPDERTLSVSDIAARSGLHVATASRIVAQLVDHGLLSRTLDRRVQIGMRMWELASRASPTRSLRDAAMPYMEDLHAVVGHHVQLSVLQGDEVIVLERLSAHSDVANYSRIAGRLPLHMTSSGLVLLAYNNTDLQERVLRGPLRQYTEATITTPARLRAALERVRGQGYALMPGHVHETATGVSAPIRDRLGDVTAALTAIVPNNDHASSTVPALLAASRGISRSLPTH